MVIKKINKEGDNVKDLGKYILSAIIFFIVFSVCEYLPRPINWFTVIIVTLIFSIINAVCQIIFKKINKKQ